MGRIRSLWILFGLVLFAASISGELADPGLIGRASEEEEKVTIVMYREEDEMCVTLKNDRVEIFNEFQSVSEDRVRKAKVAQFRMCMKEK